MFNRFQSNSQLGILVMLGSTTAFTLSVFAAYRAGQGQWVPAAIDFSLVVLISLPVLYAMRTGRTAGPGAFACVANSIGCAVACYVIGPASLPWVYVVLMTNFFIAPPKLAVTCNCLLAAAVLAMPGVSAIPFDRVSATVAAALVTLFSYRFALRVSTDHQQLEALASLDALTGVPNRRMMERALEAVVSGAPAGQRPYGLVILDIDHFKEVNDTHGHAAGDAAIADLAAILKFEMRRQDRLFRFGGEEFVVLMAVDSAEHLWMASERLRMAVRNGLRGPGGRITVSLGAAMAGSELRWQEWFSLADEALYRAKNNGRDSAVVAGHEARE